MYKPMTLSEEEEKAIDKKVDEMTFAEMMDQLFGPEWRKESPELVADYEATKGKDLR